MTATVNPRLRLIVLLGLLAAAALGAGALLMSRTAATSEAAEAPLPLLRPAKATPVRSAPAAVRPKPAKAVAKRAPVVKATPTPRTKPKPAVASNGLPLSLAAALKRHQVVVVSLLVPGASVDELARAEARAGAGDAGAGFVAMNVLDRKQGGLLAAKLGVLEAPAVLVYGRPDALFVQLEGFADRETVAQAAANAKP